MSRNNNPIIHGEHLVEVILNISPMYEDEVKKCADLFEHDFDYKWALKMLGELFDNSNYPILDQLYITGEVLSMYRYLYFGESIEVAKEKVMIPF